MCEVDSRAFLIHQTVLSSWRSLQRMVQPMASSCMKIDLLISSKCEFSFSMLRTDPSRDVEENEERVDEVGDTGAVTGAVISGCVFGRLTGGASFLRGVIL